MGDKHAINKEGYKMTQDKLADLIKVTDSVDEGTLFPYFYQLLTH